MFSKAIRDFIKVQWSNLEPSKVFISLCMIGKHKPTLITADIKELILEKVAESQSKFKYNMELKNTLFTLFEYTDGDEGKLNLNKKLSYLYS